jgi:type I restriction enzyme, R subunit
MGSNVDFDLYKIATQISQGGSRIGAGTVVPTVDRRTRVQKLVELDEDLEYTSKQLEVTARSSASIRR